MTKFLDWLKSILGNQVLSVLITKFITAENVIKIKNLTLDKVLDEIEDYCAKNTITWDEKAIKIVRDVLNVPDNDEKPTVK